MDVRIYKASSVLNALVWILCDVMLMWMFLLSSQQMDQLRIRWLLSQMTLTSNFILSLLYELPWSGSVFSCIAHFFTSLNSNQNTSLSSLHSPLTLVAWAPSAYHPYVFFHSNYRVSLDLAAAHVAVRLPLYSFISLFLLLALPSHLLLLHNPVSLTFWSKTPSEVQLFHPGIFLTFSPPWRAGMWTHLNSDLETLKVRWSESWSWQTGWYQKMSLQSRLIIRHSDNQKSFFFISVY